jgi:hypothetical protein
MKKYAQLRRKTQLNRGVLRDAGGASAAPHFRVAGERGAASCAFSRDAGCAFWMRGRRMSLPRSLRPRRAVICAFFSSRNVPRAVS